MIKLDYLVTIETTSRVKQKEIEQGMKSSRSFEAGEGEERNRIKAVEKEGRRLKGVDCETYSR